MAVDGKGVQEGEAFLYSRGPGKALGWCVGVEVGRAGLIHMYSWGQFSVNVTANVKPWGENLQGKEWYGLSGNNWGRECRKRGLRGQGTPHKQDFSSPSVVLTA